MLFGCNNIVSIVGGHHYIILRWSCRVHTDSGKFCSVKLVISWKRPDSFSCNIKLITPGILVSLAVSEQK